MKHMRSIILFAILIYAQFVFQGCSNSEDTPSARVVTENILKSKSWEATSVVVPINTATDGDDWMDFIASFTSSTMTTSGHANGAEAVWPSGAYSVSEDGKSITRGDGVVMRLASISDDAFTSIFSVPAGTEIGGRVVALDGEYTFTME